MGYWIGIISGQYASSVCPSDYCNFAEHMETSLGYSENQMISEIPIGLGWLMVNANKDIL